MKSELSVDQMYEKFWWIEKSMFNQSISLSLSPFSFSYTFFPLSFLTFSIYFWSSIIHVLSSNPPNFLAHQNSCNFLRIWLLSNPNLKSQSLNLLTMATWKSFFHTIFWNHCHLKQVNMMQGKVDVSFKIQGSKGIKATAYFTSIRRSPHSPFEVLRFLVIPDPPTLKKSTSSSASSSSSNPSDQIDMSPISLLGEDPGDSEIMRDGNGNLFQNQGAGESIGEKGRRGIVTVHDDQGELSLKRL